MLHVGERIVLEPEGVHGWVDKVFPEGAEALFLFATDLLRVSVKPRQQERWRRLLSPTEASAVERQIVTAAPIAELGWHPDLCDTVKSAQAWATVQAYLEGDREQRITAYATLLDWEGRAKQHEVRSAPWRGRLLEARSFLLGELALVGGISFDELLARLGTARASVGEAKQTAIGSRATLSELPRLAIPQPLWTPGPPATHSLGKFTIERSATILTGGWSLPGPDVDLRAECEDCLSLSLGAGTWIAKLFVQGADLPAPLKKELSEHDDGDFLRSCFEVIYRRPWLVLARNDIDVGVPRPRSGDTPASKELEHAQAWCEEHKRDVVESLPLVVPTAPGVVEPLSCVGRLEPWEHRVALVIGSRLSRAASSALRNSIDHLVCTWDWGVLFHCGNTGPLPVFAAGPESAAHAIAIPGTLS